MSKIPTAPLFAVLALTALAFPAGAQDIDAGATIFNQCQSCHVIQNDAGEILAGRSAKTGPNLYGMPGRIAGSLAGYKYGGSMTALGETDFVWTEADFVAYVQNPANFLKDKLNDDGARARMSFKLKNQEDAANVWAFIASLSPPADPDAVTE